MTLAEAAELLGLAALIAAPGVAYGLWRERKIRARGFVPTYFHAPASAIAAAPPSPHRSGNGLGWYGIGCLISWVLIFVVTWIYCIAAYGFLLGVALGWLAAAITASVSCWLWPFAVLGAIGFAIMLLR